MRFKIGMAAPCATVISPAAALLTLLLAACGGGGGGGGNTLVDTTPLTPATNPCAEDSAVCTVVQLGGAVTESRVTFNTLQNPVTLVEEGSTPPLSEVREADGAANWDLRDDIAQLALLGKFLNNASLYDPDLLYLVTANGGQDQDANSDNLVDDASAEVSAAAATPVLGRWHAILPGDLITTSRVTPLTEAVYRYLQPDLPDLTAAEIRSIMNFLASDILGDVDGSGLVDYADLLAWDRHLNADFYLHDIALVNELAAAVRGNATVSTIRDLSLSVLQRAPSSEATFTVSGSIAVPANHRVDGDVNNPAAPVTDNDSLDTAQPMDKPLVLGGYVATPGAGPTGRSSTEGDLEDHFYLKELTAAEVISLVMSESPLTNDLDLYLYRAGETVPVETSLGFTGVEQVTVPESGDYIVRVHAWNGASNYQLSVGVTPQFVQGARLSLSDDFIPGQIIARFRDMPAVNSMPRRAQFTGMRLRGGGLRRANLLQMDMDAGDNLAQRKLKTLLALKRLQRHAEVETAGLNYRVQAAITPNDPFYSSAQSWHYGMINLPAAWDVSLGNGVIVAVIDSGIRPNHPDLQGQLVQGINFLNLDDPFERFNVEDPGDGDGSLSSFHGTHVAGTVAAASNNGSGVAGAAWNAKIMPLRVLGPNGGTSYDVLQAVRYAAGLPNDSGILPSQPADVINLSLAGGGFNGFDQALYNQVTESGIVVVAAAGNDSSSTPAYPASYQGVISVSAVTIGEFKAPYSNFGASIDIAAPGGDSTAGVVSTGADDTVSPIRETYTSLIGTSMATPHVSGTIALMKSIYPALTTADFGDLLSQGLLTDDLGSPGRDNIFGWGLVNALKAVEVAQDLAGGGGVTLEPALCTSASELNFGNFAETLPLTITNCGTGVLVVEAIVPSEPWVTITPNTVDSNGVGSYTVRVDRSQLPDDSRNFSAIAIQTNVRSTVIQVIVQQPAPGTVNTGDAGLHYVLLLDAANPSEVLQEREVSVIDGIYSYTFFDVPAGRYQIVAGSDADNDLIICDPGEACGAWPVLDSEQPEIEVDRDIGDLDFSTSFNAGIISTQEAGSAETLPVRSRSGYRGPDGQR